MTTVNNYQIAITGEIISNAIKNYRQDPATRTIGMEMERFLLRADGTLPDAAEHEAFYLRLCQRLHDRVSVEPGAHMIEIKTGVHRDGETLTAELRDNLRILTEAAAEAGLTIVHSSDLPAFAADTLAHNLIARTDPHTGKTRRVWELMKAYETHGLTAIAHWGCGTTSIQLTHSVRDADALHRWSRVHAALSPLYYAAFENRTRTAGIVHEGIRMRGQMKERGLVASYIFNAQSGADFVDRYIAFVIANPLLTVLDEAGQDKSLPRPTAFRELPQAQKTLGNFLQAASFSWNTSKIKLIVDEDALLTGEIKLKHLLLEVRDMDVSTEAIPAIAGWFSTLTASDDRLREAERLLESIGVPVVSNPALAETRTRAAIEAVEKDPLYLSTVFGDAARFTTLRDAVTQVVIPLLQKHKAEAETLSAWQKVAQAKAPLFKHP